MAQMLISLKDIVFPSIKDGPRSGLATLAWAMI